VAEKDRQRGQVDEYSRAEARFHAEPRIRRVACAWRIVGRRLLLSKAISKTLSRKLTRTHTCVYARTHPYPAGVKAALGDAHEVHGWSNPMVHSTCTWAHPYVHIFFID